MREIFRRRHFRAEVLPQSRKVNTQRQITSIRTSEQYAEGPSKNQAAFCSSGCCLVFLTSCTSASSGGSTVFAFPYLVCFLRLPNGNLLGSRRLLVILPPFNWGISLIVGSAPST